MDAIRLLVKQKRKELNLMKQDLCQLSELLTERKYKSSYERVGKIIK